MNQERTIGFFAALVVLGLAYLLSRPDLISAKPERNREPVVLRRSGSPRPSLLSAFSRPSPSPSPSVAPTAAIARGQVEPEPRRTYPPESLCAYFNDLSEGESHADRDAEAFALLERSWPRDGTLAVFRGMLEGNWAEVADAERSFPSSVTAEMGLLARMRLFASGENDEAGSTPVNQSMEPRDFERLEEMKWMEPDNAFWPLLEAHVKTREGIPVDRDALILEAARRGDYRNPVSSFYSETKRAVLERGDDREYLAYQGLYSRAPILSGGFMRSLVADARAAPGANAELMKIGETMKKAQLNIGSVVPVVEGVHGNLLDAWMGHTLAARASKVDVPERERRSDYEYLAQSMGIASQNHLLVSVANDCDEERIRGYIQQLRDAL